MVPFPIRFHHFTPFTSIEDPPPPSAEAKAKMDTKSFFGKPEMLEEPEEFVEEAEMASKDRPEAGQPEGCRRRGFRC
jgi:hypothetical protein